MTAPATAPTAAPDSDRAMRPQSLAEFVGQEHIKGNLQVYIESAAERRDALDHALMLGPAGLGKTTLAQIIARELGAGFRTATGPMLTKPSDLAAMLVNLDPLDVLFIDEIHGVPLLVCEMLYTAMEDYIIDIIIGEGPAARTVRIELAPFTLLGATTHPGLLPQPLRDRFGIPLRLEYYKTDELVGILHKRAAKMGITLSPEAAVVVAKRSRGTPRIAGRLLTRMRDFARRVPVVDAAFAEDVMQKLQVDSAGLESQDRRYLEIIINDYNGGPVGLDTLASNLSEGRGALEAMIEPYLMQQGFVQRTSRGRMASVKAYKHLGIELPDALQAA